MDSLARLNRLRWDLDGNGDPATANANDYARVFPNPATGMGCPITAADGDDNDCTGYELTTNLDFNTDTGSDSGSLVIDSNDDYYNSGASWDPIGATSLPPLSNRLRDALTSVSPALERVLGPRLHHPGVRDLLARHPVPEALAQAGRGRIARIIRKRSPRLANALAAAVAAARDAQTVVEAVTGRVIAEVVAELDRTLERRKWLEAEIEALFGAHPFGRILQTLPGIGPRTGSRILAEIGDGSRFANGSRLASYAGLAPVTRQSGSSLRGEARSRRGNHRLKNAMFLAAFASLRDPASRAFYDRKRAEGKAHNAAVICLARRRGDVILAMLRSGWPYQAEAPHHHEAVAA